MSYYQGAFPMIIDTVMTWLNIMKVEYELDFDNNMF